MHLAKTKRREGHSCNERLPATEKSGRKKSPPVVPLMMKDYFAEKMGLYVLSDEGTIPPGTCPQLLVGVFCFYPFRTTATVLGEAGPRRCEWP